MPETTPIANETAKILVQNRASRWQVLAAGHEPHHQQRRDVGRQPDGEAREDDVEGDREGELHSRQQDGIEFHQATPAPRQASCLALHDRIIADMAAVRQPGKCDIAPFPNGVCVTAAAVDKSPGRDGLRWRRAMLTLRAAARGMIPRGIAVRADRWGMR